MNKIYKIKKGSKGAVVCSELAKNKGAVVVLTAIASLFTPSSFAAYEGSAIDTLNKTLVLNGDLTIDREFTSKRKQQQSTIISNFS